MPDDKWQSISMISERPFTQGNMEVFTRNLTESARIASRRQAAGSASVLDFGGPSGSSIPGILATNSPISAFLYTISRADKLSLFRYWARHDCMVGRAIELHSELPMSRVTVGPPKGPSPRQNRQITRIYESMCERLDILGLLLEVSREYWLAGDCYLWAQWSDKLMQWEDCYVLPVEFCHSIMHPFNRKKEIIFFAKPLVDTAAVRRITDRDMYMVADTDIEKLYEALGDTVPPELKEALNYGEAVPLNTNWRRGSYCIHITRNRPPNEEYGEAIIERCMDTLLRLENLKNANLQISSRNMNPKHIVTAPGVGKTQMDDLRAQIDLSMLEQVDYPIVANFEVNWNTVGAADRLLNTESEYNLLRQDLALGLGSTVEMLTGQASYGGQRITLEMMNTCFHKNMFIRMANGTQRAIDRVHVGQRVVTALGTTEKIEQLHQRDYEGDLITVRARGLTAPILCTPNHKFFTNRGDVLADDLQKGDFLISRVPVVETTQKDITDELCYLVGWFLAEGNVWERKKNDNCTDGLTFNLGGEKLVDLIVCEKIKENLVKVFSPEHYRGGSHWNKDEVKLPTSPLGKDRVLRVHYTNQTAHDFFLKECGRYSQKKQLTERWLYLPREQQRLILENWLLGDGQIQANGFLCGATASRDLRDQMVWICHRLGIHVMPWAQINGLRCNENEIRDLTDEEAILGERLYGFDVSVGEARKIWSGVVDGRVDIYNEKDRRELQQGAKKPRFWDQGKVSFLKENYSILGAQGIADYYRIKVGTVRVAYSRLGLSRPTPRKKLRVSESKELGSLNLEIQSITREFYSGIVYNIGVENEHSYHVECGAVHNCYLTFRDRMRKFVEEDLFRPVADALGHYQKEYIDVWPRVEPEDIEEGDILSQEEDGQLRRKRTLVNVLWNHSTLRFNRISIRDNAEVYDQLFQLHQKGSLAVRYLLDLHNIDPEENAQAMLEDIGTPRDPVFNDFIRAVYTGTNMPQSVLDGTDFMDRVMRGLKLGYKKPAAPAGGAGGLGGGGGGLSDVGMLGGGGGGGGLGGIRGGEGGGGLEGVPGAPGAPGAEMGGGAVPGGAPAPGAAPGVETPPPAPAASRRRAARDDDPGGEIVPGRVLPAEISKIAGRAVRELAEKTLETQGRSLYPEEVQEIIRAVEKEAQRRTAGKNGKAKPANNGL